VGVPAHRLDYLPADSATVSNGGLTAMYPETVGEYAPLRGFSFTPDGEGKPESGGGVRGGGENRLGPYGVFASAPHCICISSLKGLPICIRKQKASAADRKSVV